MDQEFDPYYETGKKMAKAYIEGGPVEGNLIMEEFDNTAIAINNAVEKFKSNAEVNILLAINSIEKSIKTTIIIVLFSISLALIITILAWIFVTRSIVNPLLFVLSKLK